MVELPKSNILAPKHGGDGVILASVICMTCAVHIIQVSGTRLCVMQKLPEDFRLTITRDNILLE